MGRDKLQEIRSSMSTWICRSDAICRWDVGMGPLLFVLRNDHLFYIILVCRVLTESYVPLTSFRFFDRVSLILLMSMCTEVRVQPLAGNSRIIPLALQAFSVKQDPIYITYVVALSASETTIFAASTDGHCSQNEQGLS